MKIDPKFYRAIAHWDQQGAGLICVTYHLDSGKQFCGVEFYELMFPVGATFSIPSSRIATFQEELRTLHQAAATFGGDRSREIAFIEQKLREAYAPHAEIQIAAIKPVSDLEPSQL